MIKLLTFLPVVTLLHCNLANAQSPSDYLPDKPGKWSYSSNIKTPGANYAVFNKNLASLAEWFHQNVPMLRNPEGFDLNAVAYSMYDDDYKLRKGNYGLRAEMDFGFQLFLSAGGKWTVEPPHYDFDINNTESGHGGMLNQGNNGSLLKELFTVFPFVKEVAPGVHYYDCEHRGCGTLVIFNPGQPDYWLPVTVREVVNAKLKYYNETDKMLYDFLKPLINKMSEEELKATAFNQSDDGILRVNGKGEGLQFMRFNPEYWDKSLPPSAIQFLAFRYNEYGLGNENADEQKYTEDEYFKNNGHINYANEMIKTMPIEKLGSLIQKK